MSTFLKIKKVSCVRVKLAITQSNVKLFALCANFMQEKYTISSKRENKPKGAFYLFNLRPLTCIF